MSAKKIAIIGAGSCGTALAIALGRSRQPHSITIWVHSADVLASLRDTRENSVYLPGAKLPESVNAITSDMGEALSGASIVLGVMPSAHARAIYASMAPHIASLAWPAPIFVSATKGIEHDSLQRMSQVMHEVLGPKALGDDALGRRIAPRLAVLSGPSFAVEIARGDPTAVVIASGDAQAAEEIQGIFSGPSLRLYTNSDVIGVELGGSVKNVIAIAAGVCAGLGLGSNTIASLVTRGLAEMTRLTVALGGRRDTCAGLAGLGDLVLTATGSLSRNRAVGVELGRGRALSDILGRMRMVAEGVGTTAATLALARRHGVEMPIAEQMHAVLNEGRAPAAAIRELMDRKLTQE